MKRALAVALAGPVALACHAGSSSPSADAASAVDTVDVAAFVIRKNPITEDGRILYMGGGEGCHYVAASVDVPGLMAAIDQTEGTGCQAMQDPAWRECPFGAVYARADGSECVCRASGKPARKMACPGE